MPLTPKHPPGRITKTKSGCRRPSTSCSTSTSRTLLRKRAPLCRLGANEIYERVKGTGTGLAELARDETDYKALIAQARDTAEKVAWAQRIATRRLASGVVPELDKCFAALDLR